MTQVSPIPASGVFDFAPRDQVVWGKPAAEAVREVVERLNARRVFIVTIKILSETTPIIADIRAALGDRCAGVFDDCREHTPFDNIVEAAVAARDADADLLLSVGGGSVIDLTKITIVCLREKIFSVERLIQQAGLISPLRDELRQISIPTTLAGAEHTILAGGTNPENDAKTLVGGLDLCPVTVILDPAVSLHTPEKLWLSTAIRAIDHAIEGYCAQGTYPYLQAQALGALGLFATSLRRTKADPTDLDARLQSQHAVWLATPSLGRVPMGASHGLGYLLGTLGHVPHGYTSCVFLPAVLKWNEPVTGAAQAEISRAMGRPGEPACDVVRTLIADLELPGTLRDVGASKELVAQIADQALSHPIVLGNPRPITSRRDVEEILDLAW